jgi:hypothetical protein
MLAATHKKRGVIIGESILLVYFTIQSNVDNVSPYICSKSDYIKSLSSHTGLTRFQAPRILVGEASLGSLQNN